MTTIEAVTNGVFEYHVSVLSNRVLLGVVFDKTGGPDIAFALFETYHVWYDLHLGAVEVPLASGSRFLSTSPEYEVAVGNRQLQFRNTNNLVRNPTWEIGLQKTGYISEAGRCLVMQAQLAGRKLIMVFLDSAGKYSRIGDAERVRKWINETTPAAVQSVTLPTVTS